MVEKILVMVAGHAYLVKFLEKGCELDCEFHSLRCAKSPGENASAIPIGPSNSTNSPEQVDGDVAEARGSTWDKTLVKLVADGV